MGRPKGQTPWNKGRKETRLEVLHRQSLAHKGQLPWTTGKRRSQATITKIRLTKLGSKRSLESRDKQRRTMLLRHRNGKHFTEESIRKIKIARMKQTIPMRDTKPERAVQSVLAGLGLRFRTHVPITLKDKHRHQVDIQLADSPHVFEVDGCYWHQCIQCGFNGGAKGLTARQVREKDALRDCELQGKGFVVHKIWGHETRDLMWLTEKVKRLNLA